MAEIVVNAPGSVIIGDEFDVPITVDSVTNFDAGQFDITIDKSKIQLVSIDNGKIDGTAIPIAIWNEITPGTYRIVVNVPGIPGVSGAGSLAVIKFKALGVGETSIGISNGFINDNAAHEIVSSYAGDRVNFFRPGDSNMDGVVDNRDIDYLVHIIVGLQASTLGADANRDGVINTADLTAIEILMQQAPPA